MMEIVITSSILILALLFIRFLFRGKISSRLQYGLWLLVAARLLFPFSVSAPVSVMNVVDTIQTEQFITGRTINIQPASSDLAKSSIVQPGSEVNAAPSLRPYDVIKFVWLGGAAAVGIWFLVVNFTFYVKLRKERRRFQADGCKLLVYIADSISSPCLFGLIKPAIYVSPEVSRDQRKLRHVVTHELCHYAQLDHIWSAVRCVCAALHWFNPLVWAAAACSRFDCELSCDELALKRLGNEERLTYGRTLIELVVIKTSPSALVSAATTMTSSGRRMKGRISMIAQSPKTMIKAVIAVIVVLGITTGCTFTGAYKGAAEDKAAVSTISDSTTAQDSPTSLEQLKAILSKNTTNKIMFFQSFAAAGNKEAAFATVDGGEVWYVTDSGAQKLKTGFSFQPDTAFLWKVDNTIIFKCEDAPGGSSSVSYAWYVKDGKAVELHNTGMNLSYIGNGQFTTIGEGFDLNFTDGLGTGHTYKLYYLYWTADGLKEYGGLKITEQQLLKISGAKAVIDAITQAGNTVDEIYYRANNIININYHSGDKQNGDFNNVTLVYKNNTVTPQLVYPSSGSSQTESLNKDNLADFSFGGIFKAAFFPEIATYPDKI